MRQDCKHFQSRTYQTGDTVRKCVLDLAPEAPWRCPQDCESFTPRLADVNWRKGTLISPPTPAEPVSVGQDSSVGDLLDEAENIINAAGPKIRRELEQAKAKERLRNSPKRKFRPSWWPFGGA